MKDRALKAVMAATPVIIAVMLITAVNECRSSVAEWQRAHRSPVAVHKPLRVAFAEVSADECAPPEEVAFGDAYALPLDTDLIEDGVMRHLSADGLDAPELENA